MMRAPVPNDPAEVGRVALVVLCFPCCRGLRGSWKREMATMNTVEKLTRTTTSLGSVTTSSSHDATWRAFIRHFLEMVVAMIVGMAVFGAIVWGIFGLLGHASLRHYAGFRALVMAINMIIGMSLWMRHRRHSWAAIGEMAGAMFVPYVALLGPYLAGVLSGPALLGAMHLLMLPAMVLAMLHRRDEYTSGHTAGKPKVVRRRKVRQVG